MRTGRFVVGVLAAALIAACSHHDHERAPVVAPPPAHLSAARPCLGGAAVTCARLDVPLDHSGRTPGRLSLRVAIAGSAAAPRGTIVG